MYFLSILNILSIICNISFFHDYSQKNKIQKQNRSSKWTELKHLSFWYVTLPTHFYYLPVSSVSIYTMRNFSQNLFGGAE